MEVRTDSVMQMHQPVEPEEGGAGSTLRRTGLVEQVHEQICEALMLGRYAPGSRLNIRQLAAAIHVSATPVREALSRLVSESVLETTSTRAVVVPQIEAALLDEVFDLRAQLEGDLAEAAVARLDDLQRSRLRDIQTQLASALALGDFGEAVRCNARFHFGIYQAAGRPLTLQMVRGLWLRIGPMLQLNYPALAAVDAKESRHHRILDALTALDPVAARASVVADLRASQVTIRGLLQRVVQ